MHYPKYQQKPIYKLESLGLTLGLKPIELRQLARESDKCYYRQELPKKDGKTRVVYSISPRPKNVLKTIKRRILDKVDYPTYLHGSIKGRSPKTNAENHIGVNTLIKLDIKSFFDSVKADEIYKVWIYFFHFSPEVSRLLTELVTYKGSLPQGSPTSSSIANLILCYDGSESQLVKQLQEKGMRYSRYVDDIAISSSYALANKQKTEIIKAVHSMLKRKDLSIKNSKTGIHGARNRKKLTGLVIGHNKVSIEKTYADCTYHDIKSGKPYSDRELASIKGKINHIRQFNPKQAERLEYLLRTQTPE